MDSNILKSITFLFFLFISICCTNDIPENGKDPGTGTDTIDSGELIYKVYKTYAYVQIDFVDDQKEYFIEYPQKVTSAVIRPYQLNIAASINEKKVSFKLPKAGSYVAYINGFKIIIYAESREVLPSGASVINVAKDIGCDTTGNVNETNRIQSAINSTPSGKILYFPRGRYLVSQLKIRNKTGFNIHLARGAELVADTMNLSTYDLTDVFGAAGPSNIVGRDTWPNPRAFILIDECQQLNITGYGMINGQGRAARRNSVNMYGREGSGRYHNIIITRSKDVRLDGIISADPGAWNTHIIKSRNITCHNVKLMNELNYAPIPGNVNEIDHDRVNTDGFDIDSSSDVLIENCFGYCGDDNVVIKTTQSLGLLDNVDGVMVRGNVFITQKSSMKVGTETGADEMKNILFYNNDVLEADRAIALYCYDGANISNVKWENNRVEDCYENSQKRIVAIEILPRVTGSKAGCATSVEINDTYIRKTFPNKSRITYSNINASSSCAQSGAESMQVSISNYVINGNKIDKLSDEFTTSGSPSVIIE